MGSLDVQLVELAHRGAALGVDLKALCVAHRVSGEDESREAHVVAQMIAALDRFAAEARSGGATGLQLCCEWLVANLRDISLMGQSLQDEQLQMIETWPQAVQSYLQKADVAASAARLTARTQVDCWPLRPSSADAVALHERLLRFAPRLPLDLASLDAAASKAIETAREQTGGSDNDCAPVPGCADASILETSVPVLGADALSAADAAESARDGLEEADPPPSATQVADESAALRSSEHEATISIVDEEDVVESSSVGTVQPGEMPGEASGNHLPSCGDRSAASLGEETLEADAVPNFDEVNRNDDPDLSSPHTALDQLRTSALQLLETAVPSAALTSFTAALDGAVGLIENAGQIGLLDCLLRIRENADLFANEGKLVFDDSVRLFDVAMLLTEALSGAEPQQAAASLIEHLASPQWRVPLSEEEAAAIRTMLDVATGAATPARFDDRTDVNVAESEWAATPVGCSSDRDAPGGPDIDGHHCDAGTLVDTVSEAESSADAALHDEEVVEGDVPPATHGYQRRERGRQQADPANVAMLERELHAFEPLLAASLASAADNVAPDERAEHVDAYVELIQRLVAATDAIGLSTLAEVLQLVAERVASRREAGLDAAARRWLTDFPQRVRAYLNAPQDPSAASGLIEVLGGESWPTPIDQHLAADLEQALLALDLVADKAAVPERSRVATPNDVSLAPPEDISAELLDGLLSELPVQSAEFASAIHRVAGGSGSLYDLEVAKRAAHTLKGAANTVGVRGIANLTHHVEDILIALTRAGQLPKGPLADVLSNAADCLESMSEALLGVSPAPHDAQHVLQQILDLANRIDADGVETSASEEEAARPAAQDEHEADNQPAGKTDELPAQVGAPGTGGPMLRVSASLVDELLRLVGETMIANAQIKEQLRLSRQHAQDVSQQSSMVRMLAGELEQLIDVRGLASPIASGRAEFDSLEFEHYNELHTVTRRLIEASTDAHELSGSNEQRMTTLADLIERQDRLHLENQGIVMKTRMVPVSSIVPRLQRSVRQTCRLLEKRVNLVVLGAQTSIDGNVLNALVEPLMHLLRNSIDHGIEPPGARRNAGKAAEGRIELTFSRDGASILVRVADDGAGLNLTAIRARAVEQGLLSHSAAITDDELARLIVLPGFSTRDEATQVSGRGIGMDAVNTVVLGLNGSLRLHTTAGRGLTVELRLPASLMTTHGLLVKHENRVVAISSYGVQDIRYVTNDQLETVGDAIVYRERDRVFTLDSLDRLIGHGKVVGPDKRGWFPALMVQTESGALRAIQVHDVLDSQDFVVKNFGHYVARPAGVAGVTVLGDGSIAPVLDLPQMLRAPVGAAVQLPRGRVEHSRIEARLSALVIDDSLSARRAASQLMSDAGFDVRTAIDGLEAAAMIEKRVPDVILVDMEMPRMNGLEFTAHVRSRDATRSVPIIMITSRSTDKHRRQAEAAGVNVYLTKPFANDALLEQVERLTKSSAGKPRTAVSAAAV